MTQMPAARAEQRGETASFISFADTVSARNYVGENGCHAWMSIRFQAEPQAEDSVIHARVLDDNNPDQQEALEIVGVNLIHSAYTCHFDVNTLVSACRSTTCPTSTSTNIRRRY